MANSRLPPDRYRKRKISIQKKDFIITMEEVVMDYDGREFLWNKIRIKIIFLAFILGLVAILVGAYSIGFEIYSGRAFGEQSIDLVIFKANITSVGLGSIFLGLTMTYFTFKKVLLTISDSSNPSKD